MVYPRTSRPQAQVHGLGTWNAQNPNEIAERGNRTFDRAAGDGEIEAEADGVLLFLTKPPIYTSFNFLARDNNTSGASVYSAGSIS